jgi:hypothetical protein
MARPYCGTYVAPHWLHIQFPSRGRPKGEASSYQTPLCLERIEAPLLQQVTGCYSFLEQPTLSAKVKC